MSKKVALIGASGTVGGMILKELLARSWEVEALVRNPAKITIKNPDLTVKKVDVSDEKALEKALRGYENVISSYNPGWTNPNIYEDTLSNYPKIVQAAKDAHVKRLLIVGGAGTLFIAPGKRLMDSGALPPEILPGVKSLGKFYLDDLMGEKDIDWVFFSPAGMFLDRAQGKRTGKYRLGKDDLITDANGESKISLQDYAKAMVDELSEPGHHRERFTIGY